MQLAGEESGDRLGVGAQALDPGGDGLVIVARLLLGGAQAAPVQYHLKGADDLRNVRLQAIERSSERLPERSPTGKAAPAGVSVLPLLAHGLGRATARARRVLGISRSRHIFLQAIRPYPIAAPRLMPTLDRARGRDGRSPPSAWATPSAATIPLRSPPEDTAHP